MLTRGTIAASKLAGLSADPLVFLTDVTPTAVRRDLVAASIQDGAAANVITTSAYWAMEDLGLEHFK